MGRYEHRMIYESQYWKDPLLAGAGKIRELFRQEDMTDEQYAEVERELFMGFYSIRKLMEAVGKVSKETREMKLTVSRYPKLPKAPIVDWYNRSDFWELYNLDKPQTIELDILFVSNRMIHSFIFILSGGEDGDGVFFNSDYDKDKQLYFVDITEILRAFETVGNDYPSTLHAWRDSESGEMKWSVDPVPNSPKQIE